MSPRKLRPDELKLWQRVAKTTDKLMRDAKPEEMTADVFLSADRPKQTLKTPSKFRVGETAKTMSGGLPGIANGARGPALQMDKRAYDKLKRGKLKPEATIDLHGMTMDQAKPALTAFLLSSFAVDRRLVLVITGKGKGNERNDFGAIPERPGILRRNVPHWLQCPPLRQVVLQVTEAHGKHGGAGAYYVYLRRKR